MQGTPFLVNGAPYSEQLANLLDRRAKQLVESALADGRRLLEQKRQIHRRLAEMLYEKEVLSQEELAEILGSRPAEQ